jgi:glycosyltransferase involved in cell wall biosynthesis
MSVARVAAIVPVYNRPSEVIEALESIAGQTEPPARLIVVDDGSTDDSAQRVEKWLAAKSLPFAAKLVRQPNSGASVARNRGAVEAGDCELLAYLDSDDLWPADYLQRMTDALARSPAAVAASCDRKEIDFARKRERLYPQSRIETETTATILIHGSPNPSQTVMRTTAFQTLGGFNTSMMAGEEDYHFALRLSLLGRWTYVPGAPLIKRMGTSAVTGGEPSLGRKFAERTMIRARMMERFIREEGGGAVMPEQTWRRWLAHLWYRAGRRLLELNRNQEAGECFRRALELWPRHLRARWRALTTRPH